MSATMCRMARRLPRCYSTKPALTALEPLGVVAPSTRVLRMCRPPVNSLSLEVFDSMIASLSEAEADPECRAIVLASAQPNVFSAGLDITEMHAPDPSRLREFWNTFQEAWMRLSSSSLATIAAIEGHSPAGGCVLAISCDWRVMSAGDPVKGKPFTIGLNETQLGIVAPPWIVETFQSVVGIRLADSMLQRGALVSSERAAAIGLIDEVVAHADVVERAAVAAKELLSVPDAARHQSKLLTRQPIIDRLESCREADNEAFSAFCLSAPVQQSLTAYLAALKKKSSAK